MKSFKTNSLPKILRLTNNWQKKFPPLTYDNHKRNWISQQFDVIDCFSEKELMQLLMLYRYDVEIIVTYSNKPWNESFPSLASLPEYYKERWFHFQDSEDHGSRIYKYVMHQFLDSDERKGRPFISFVTPLYNTSPQFLKDCYESLKQQKIDNWEWVLLDDSLEELDAAIDLSDSDLRVMYYRITPTDGNIGKAKWYANCMSEGKWLMELDHDDMLTDYTLEYLTQAIKDNPDCGFFYSDTLMVDKKGTPTPMPFADGFAFGYGHPYKVKTPDGSMEMQPLMAVPLNPATLRHIVGVPNHFRCWRRDVYFNIGGHNTLMRICDDYEILLRTFLNTEMCHIKYPCYKQRWLEGENSQDGGGGENRKDIQRRVDIVADFYNKRIHDRINELSGDKEKEWRQSSAEQTYRLYTPANCDWYVNHTWVPSEIEQEDEYYKEKYGK